MKMGLDHFLIVPILLSTGLQVAIASEWGYWGKNGPDNWPGICTTGKKQSPINIVTSDTLKIDLGPLSFGRYNLSFPATLNSDGHSVTIELYDIPVHLNGGNLQSVYVLDHMHFHWSAEHTVDDLRDPLELHLVHYDNQYANFSEAAQHQNGIAVVSVLFKLNKYDNPHLKSILKATRKVSRQIGKSAVVKGNLMPLLFLPKNHKTYYHYEGSLTTPECQESVSWFVLTEKHTVSKAQVNIFKQVRGDKGKQRFNYRPVQELNDRKVYLYLE